MTRVANEVAFSFSNFPCPQSPMYTLFSHFLLLSWWLFSPSIHSCEIVRSQFSRDGRRAFCEIKYETGEVGGRKWPRLFSLSLSILISLFSVSRLHSSHPPSSYCTINFASFSRRVLPIARGQLPPQLHEETPPATCTLFPHRSRSTLMTSNSGNNLYNQEFCLQLRAHTARYTLLSSSFHPLSPLPLCLFSVCIQHAMQFRRGIRPLPLRVYTQDLVSAKSRIT